MKNERTLMGMSEYIEREDAIRILRGRAVAKYPSSFTLGIFASADELKNIPAADVAQVRHGHWRWDGRFRACSICGSYVEFTETLGASHWNYCPHCGAKMEGTNA